MGGDQSDPPKVELGKGHPLLPGGLFKKADGSEIGGRRCARAGAQGRENRAQQRPEPAVP